MSDFFLVFGVQMALLIFLCLSSVDDKHDVRDSHTCLSDVSRQDNLKETQRHFQNL